MSEWRKLLYDAIPAYSSKLDFPFLRSLLSHIIRSSLKVRDTLYALDLCNCLNEFEHVRQNFLSAQPHSKIHSFIQKYDIHYEVVWSEYLPSDGSYQVLLNHPTWILDGVLALDCINKSPFDVQLLAMNLFKIFDPDWYFLELVNTMKKTSFSQHERDELMNKVVDGVHQWKPLLIFPAWDISVLGKNGQRTDTERKTFALRVAELSNKPLIMVYLDIPTDDPYKKLWNWWSSLWVLHAFLHELRSSSEKSIRIIIRKPVYASEVLSLVAPDYATVWALRNEDYKLASQVLKRYLYSWILK